MKIAVFGQTLYAGVMAGLWAETGHQVYWHTNSEQEIAYSFDESLNRLIQQQQQLGTLQNVAFDEIPTDVQAYFFALNASDEAIVSRMVQQLAERAEVRPKLMLNGCTFGLHGTEKLKQFAAKDVWAYLPDVIQEGNAIQSFLQLKQVVVGAEQDYALQLTQEILRPFFPLKQQFLTMPILDAEFTKLSISGMLATRISYMNDLSQVAEKLGIDILNVRQGLASDGRIGSVYLSAGVGFGGENFSNDILTLANTVLNTGVKSRLLEQVWQINESQKEILFRKLWNYYHGNLADKTIALWGAAFKENTSRIEYSPTLAMIDALLAQGATVQLHDPQALDEIRKRYAHQARLILCDDAYAATQNAHALCLMTAWKQYFSPDFVRLKQQMHHPLLLDGRNIYDP
ncbi:MAG: nucleotide sugar dehydrogenase, partial [Acinetobacter sp.]|nr:nucleotide sugar dehydrogenase [Acinetobacter sp.]